MISDLRKSEEVPSSEGKLGTETAKIGLESAKTGSDTVKIASDGVKTGSEAVKSVEALKAGGESDEKQRERKRRAEMFLKMLQRTGSADLVVGGSSVKKTAKGELPSTFILIFKKKKWFLLGTFISRSSFLRGISLLFAGLSVIMA